MGNNGARVVIIINFKLCFWTKGMHTSNIFANDTLTYFEWLA